MAGKFPYLGHEKEFPHALFSLTVQNAADLRTLELVPASETVARLLEQHTEERVAPLQRPLCAQGNRLAVLKSFEAYATLALAVPGKYRIRRLGGDDEEELVMGQRREQEVRNSEFKELSLAPDVLYTPADPIFPCIRAWTSSDMFKMKADCKVKVAKTEDWRFLRIRELVQNKRIIYVVPEGAPSRGEVTVGGLGPGLGLEEWLLELPL